MKIDTSMIPNFDALPDEAKNAILAMEFADAPDMSQFVAKSTFDRKASEAADLTKKLKSYMSEDEAKKVQEAEERAALIERAEKAERALTVSTYEKAYLALGFDDKLAKSTAEALVSGDMDTVFKNQKINADNREKALRTELLKNTPSPAPGKTDVSKTKEEFSRMTLAEKARFAEEHPDEYKEFYGG